MNLPQALLALYPDLHPAFDYMVAVEDDGRVMELRIWDEKKLGPRPSDEVLAAKMAEPVPEIVVAKNDRPTPAEKLAAFLTANPDVADMVEEAKANLVADVQIAGSS